MKYHGSFTSFKSHLYWKQGSSIFFLIWLMECSIYLHVWLAKKFCDTLTLYNLIKLHTYYNFEKVKVQQNKY